MDWPSGTFLWSMIGLVYWVTICWMVIMIVPAVIRRDMSGWVKAGWIALIVLMPFVGVLIYVVVMPDSRGDHEADHLDARPTPLYDKERLSAEAFERIGPQR